VGLSRLCRTGWVVLLCCLLPLRLVAQETPVPVPSNEGQSEVEPATGAGGESLVQPPSCTRWLPALRYQDAQALAGAASDPARIAEAIEAFKLVEVLYPGSGLAGEAAWQIVQLTTRYGDAARNLAAYEAYAHAYPDGDYACDAAWNAISLYLQLPDYDTAYAKYDEFLREYPQSPYGDVAMNALATNYRTKRDYPAAVDAYRQLLKRYPTSDYSDDAWYYMLTMYATAPYNVDAATDAALHLANEYPYSDFVDTALYQLVLLYYQTGDPIQALALGNKFLAAFPTSSNATYVKTYMMYAERQVRAATGVAPNTDPNDPNSPEEVQRQQAAALYDEATKANRERHYTEAVALYQEFIARFPRDNRTDDALWAIGGCFEALERFYADAGKAAVPEDIRAVAEEWQRVASAFGQPAANPQNSPLQDAVTAYIVLATSMPGSDYRDDAVYRAGACYEAMNETARAMYAYLELVHSYPVSSHATEALGRIHALVGKLENPRQRAFVWQTVLDTYPQWCYSDDYLYDLGIEALKASDLQTARQDFHRYIADYPHRQLAADALMWAGRLEQAMGAAVAARPLFERLLREFPNSGLADDAYVELVRLARGEAPELVREADQILASCAQAVGTGLAGYDCIIRSHVALVVPPDKAIDARAYDLPDRLDDACGQLAAWSGGAPYGQGRLVLLVDPSATGVVPGEPVRLGADLVGPPPQWAPCFQGVATLFMSDPAVAHVTQALPGLAQGLAEYCGWMLEESLHEALGELNLGPGPVATHLARTNQAKARGANALNAFVQQQKPPEALDGDVGLGMVWSTADRLNPTPGALIDWAPLQPLLPAARQVPAVAGQMQTPEEKCALVAYWWNQALGSGQDAILRSWGLPITPALMTRVEKVIKGEEPPVAPAQTPPAGQGTTATPPA